MVTQEVLNTITKQYTNVPVDIMKQWVDILIPEILPHWRTSHTVANFYVKTFALCVQKLQHVHPNANNDALAPVALTRALHRLSASAAIQEHAIVFTRLWNERKSELSKQMSALERTNPWHLSK